jgi:hypothetical protein
VKAATKIVVLVVDDFKEWRHFARAAPKENLAVTVQKA